MDQLPVFLNLGGKPVLVIGEGDAAGAKRRLVEAAGGIPGADEENARIAFIAVEDESEARRIAGQLRARGILVNVVDRPELCDFTVPAIVDRSPVLVAVGTGGASATLAKVLRERLEALLPASLGRLAGILRGARARARAQYPDAADRRRFWDALLAPGGRLDPLGDCDAAGAAIDAALADTVAAGSLTEIETGSADPDDLTLRQLRALSRADVIVHDEAVPDAILGRARRDARRALPHQAGAVSGQVVVIKWTGR